MGVTQLWQILAPVEQHRPLSSLAGQTLAVDLSIWVCENQCVKQMQGVVAKPYLRNVFFRILHLIQLGVKLVFVIEGSAPDLKWDTMMKRQQARFPGRQGKGAGQKPAGKQRRGNFNNCLKECCELLEILGIPYVQSKGEAEALCAVLDMAGLVDGCLTNDGDCFLYGATTVYRNFTMNVKDPHVEMYRVADIERKLGIDRGGLVALGLLIGCDYVPKGVPGVGVANAVKLLQTLHGRDVISRLREWRSMAETECLDQIEILARRKAIAIPDFPQLKVIDEFMVAADRCPSRLSPWKRPVPVKLQEFALVKMEWPVDYSLEKILPLVTLWDMTDILQSRNPSRHQHLKPHRIVKTRVRQGEACFEVEWCKPVTDTLHEGSYYVTVEAQDMFSKCFPTCVATFNTTTAEAKKKPKGKKKKAKGKDNSETAPSLDSLSFQLDKLNISDITNKLTESAKGLPPDFTDYTEANLKSKAKQPKHLTVSSVSGKSATSGKSAPSKNLPAAATKSVAVSRDMKNERKDSDIASLMSNKSENISEEDKSSRNACEKSSKKHKPKSKVEITHLNEGCRNKQGQTGLYSRNQICGNSSPSPGEEETCVPLSQRVKLRMQGKQANIETSRRHSLTKPSVCELSKPDKSIMNNDELSDMSSLLEEIENLSFKEKQEETPSREPFLRVNTKFPITPTILPTKFHRPDFSRNFTTAVNSQKMSSPSSDAFCSPLTYFKHSMAGDSPSEMKGSPIPIVAFDSLGTKTDKRELETVEPVGCQSAASSGNLEKKTREFKNAAEILMAKIESGISSVGKSKQFDMEKFSFFDKPKKDEKGSKVRAVPEVLVSNPGSKQSAPLNSCTPKSTAKPTGLDKSRQLNMSALGLNMSELGLDTSNVSQLGDFQIQTSLLNSMCSSLIQALTPKGVSMSKQEYESLMDTLREIDGQSDDEPVETQHQLAALPDEVACNIDFSDVEKASSNLKKIKPGVTLEPIRLVGESAATLEQAGGLSKSAKKKLRRKERKRALEDIAHLNNMALRAGDKMTDLKEQATVEKKMANQNSNSCLKNTLSLNSENVETTSSKTRTVCKQNDSKKTDGKRTVCNQNDSKKTDGKMSKEEIATTTNNKMKKKNGKSDKNCNGEKLSENVSFIYEKKNESDSGTVKTAKTDNPTKSRKTCTLSETQNKSVTKTTIHPMTVPLNDSKRMVASPDFISSKEPMFSGTGPEVSETDVAKVKKKKKKKKVKKASPFMDLSADGSMNFGRNGLLAEYLNSALVNTSNLQKSSVIQKASPVFDLSADEETLFELEDLSNMITGENQPSTTSASRMKLKLSLQKNKMKKQSETNVSEIKLNEPVLALDKAFDNVEGITESKQDDEKVEEAIEGHIEREEESDVDNSQQDVIVKDNPPVRCLPNFDDILGPDDDQYIEVKSNIQGNECSVQMEHENGYEKCETRMLDTDKDLENDDLKRNEGSIIEKEHCEIETFEENGSDFQKIAQENVISVSDATDETAVDYSSPDVEKANKYNDVENPENSPVGVDLRQIKMELIENTKDERIDQMDNHDADSVENTGPVLPYVVENVCESIKPDNSDVNGILNEIEVETGMENGVDILTKQVVDKIGDAECENIELKNSLTTDVENKIDPDCENQEGNRGCIVSRQSGNDTKCTEILSSRETENMNGTAAERRKKESDIFDCLNQSNKGCSNDDLGDAGNISDDYCNDDDDDDDDDLCFIIESDVIQDANSEESDLNINGANTKMGEETNGATSMEVLDTKTEDTYEQVVGNGSQNEDIVHVGRNGDQFALDPTQNGNGASDFMRAVQDVSGHDDVQSQVVQSPACLADRLKLKLRKTSTRNVLQSFTNGNH